MFLPRISVTAIGLIIIAALIGRTADALFSPSLVVLELRNPLPVAVSIQDADGVQHIHPYQTGRIRIWVKKRQGVVNIPAVRSDSNEVINFCGSITVR